MGDHHLAVANGWSSIPQPSQAIGPCDPLHHLVHSQSWGAVPAWEASYSKKGAGGRRDLPPAGATVFTFAWFDN